MKNCLIPTFWALVGVFAVVLSQFCIPVFRELLRGSLWFLLPFAIFSLLGAALLFLTFKEKVTGKLKKFLLLTGASATGFFVFVLLHNLIYGLFRVEEPFFFIMAIFVCPIGFLVGIIGSIILFVRKGRQG